MSPVAFIPTHRDEAIEKVAKKLFEKFDTFFEKDWDFYKQEFRVKPNIYLEAGTMIIEMIEEGEL